MELAKKKPIVCDAERAINRVKWGQLDEKIKWERKNNEVRGSCHKREPFVTTLQTNFLETLQTHIKVFRKSICC